MIGFQKELVVSICAKLKENEWVPIEQLYNKILNYQEIDAVLDVLYYAGVIRKRGIEEVEYQWIKPAEVNNGYVIATKGFEIPLNNVVFLSEEKAEEVRKEAEKKRKIELVVSRCTVIN